MADRFVLALNRVLVHADDQAAAERVTARFTDTVGLPFVFEYRGVYYKDDTLIELSAAAPLRGDSFERGRRGADRARPGGHVAERCPRRRRQSRCWGGVRRA